MHVHDIILWHFRYIIIQINNNEEKKKYENDSNNNCVVIVIIYMRVLQFSLLDALCTTIFNINISSYERMILQKIVIL